MKFAHLADCHVGAWREPKLRDLTLEAFATAIDTCIAEQVDFALIAGDLFHSAIPSLDAVKVVFKHLRRLRQAGIPLYYITGSHDYSPTGKTMLDVIEEAGLGTNVFRGTVRDESLHLAWTIDEKTGVKLTGVLGRANQLEREIYTAVDRTALEAETGTKIFLFHTSIAELTSTSAIIDSAPISLLPDGCAYYAGGHVHTPIEQTVEGKHIVYPGPLFPASFSELEALGGGSLVLYEDGKTRRVTIKPKPVITCSLDLNGIEPGRVASTTLETLDDVQDAIVLIRASGTLAGKTSEIAWHEIHDELVSRGAYAVLRNTAQLASPQLEQSLISAGSVQDIESHVIQEHDVDAARVKAFMDALSATQADGERKAAFEERVLAAADATASSWRTRPRLLSSVPQPPARQD